MDRREPGAVSGCDKGKTHHQLAPKTPDLNLLPIVIALYDELSVSRAARQIGMSQPAVSNALRRLREAFDDQLFVRGPAGILPTPRAHAIVRASRVHLQHLQEDLLKGEQFDPSSSTRAIVLGLSDIAEMAFLPSILDHLRVHAPKAPVRTVTVPDVQLAEGLEKGDVDVAAGYFPALAQRNFRQRRLSKHGFACLLRAGHPLWKKRLTVGAYLAADHIAIRREGRSQEQAPGPAELGHAGPHRRSRRGSCTVRQRASSTCLVISPTPRGTARRRTSPRSASR